MRFPVGAGSDRPTEQAGLLVEEDMPNVLRFIGDVHGRFELYRALVEGASNSIQVGDLALGPSHLLSSPIDVERHRAIAGNHDDYGRDSEGYVGRDPRFLGDFGLHRVPGFPPLFFVRGAWSIDQEWRKRQQGYPDNQFGPVTWWPEEELDDEGLDRAFDAYVDAGPEIMVTHECPIEIVQYVTDPQFVRYFGFNDPVIPTRTNRALQRMFEAHRPRLWIFGHYHRRWEGRVEGTTFLCLDMLRDDGSDESPAYFDLKEGAQSRGGHSGMDDKDAE